MLIPSNLETNFALTQTARAIATHLAFAANLANDLNDQLLNLGDEALAEWISTNGAAAESLFAAQALVGERINSAAEAAATVTSQPAHRQVDVRPFAEKLADRGRGIVVEGGVAAVVRQDKELPDAVPPNKP